MYCSGRVLVMINLNAVKKVRNRQMAEFDVMVRHP
jgi:hypothetical protein